LPETSAGKPTLPETSAGKPALPETSAGKPTLPETSAGKPALPETSAGKPALPKTSAEKPALPETSTEKPALPESPPQGIFPGEEIIVPLGRRKGFDDLKKKLDDLFLGEKKKEISELPSNVIPFKSRDELATKKAQEEEPFPGTQMPILSPSTTPGGLPPAAPETLPEIGGKGQLPLPQKEEPETKSLEETPEEPIRHKLPEEEKVIQGVLKMEKEEESPYIKLTYDFHKLPFDSLMSKDNQIFEYAYYKYKPMLEKAWEFVRRRQLKKALNYYRTIVDQPIPVELKDMILTNIKDINQYMEKYLRSDFQVRYFQTLKQRQAAQL
jgi:hypothetical protein